MATLPRPEWTALRRLGRPVKFRGLRLATQFLTRVPVPAVENFSAEEFSRSSAWFPIVGLAMGVVVSAIIFVCAHRNAPVAAVLGLLAWVWMTGALHLDGLADLSDALAAAHRDARKFFAVLADPHFGRLRRGEHRVDVDIEGDGTRATYPSPLCWPFPSFPRGLASGHWRGVGG